MKIVVLLGLIALLLGCNSKSETIKDKGNWNTYQARYENGPGSVMLNMDLINYAPIKDLPFVVITGVRFTNCAQDGFPEKNEFDSLYRISDDVEKLISGLTKVSPAGSFTYQCERLDYIYIGDTIGIREKLTKLYVSKYSNYKHYINIQQDTNWNAYLQFLYPNKEIQEAMKSRKSPQ